MAPREHYGDIEEFEGDVIQARLADVLGRPKAEAPVPHAPGHLFPDCSAYREREAAKKRRDRFWTRFWAVIFLLTLAAANHFNPCRPNGGVSCSEVSR